MCIYEYTVVYYLYRRVCVCKLYKEYNNEFYILYMSAVGSLARPTKPYNPVRPLDKKVSVYNTYNRRIFHKINLFHLHRIYLNILNCKLVDAMWCIVWWLLYMFDWLYTHVCLNWLFIVVVWFHMMLRYCYY